MWLQHLVITDFKNIAEADMDFCPGVNCLLGSNGMGKSNLLEAVHFLSFTRPVRSVAESSLIRHGCSGLLVKGIYDTGHANSDTVSCGIVAGRGKKLMLNGKEYDRISSHIGRFPIVTVSPDDSDLIRGSAQERRRLMDMVISQTDSSYLPLLMHYNRALTSRNSMLRAGVSDTLLYESIEQAMEDAAAQIYRRRSDWTEEISASFAAHYAAVAADGYQLAGAGFGADGQIAAVALFHTGVCVSALQGVVQFNVQVDVAAALGSHRRVACAIRPCAAGGVNVGVLKGHVGRLPRVRPDGDIVGKRKNPGSG